MSSILSLFRLKARQEKKAKILILGLDNSGKTTLTKFMRFGVQNGETRPTIGQNIDSFEVEGWNVTSIDVAGQAHFRFLWDSHYPGTSACIFVIDSADIERLPEARDVLKSHVFNNPYLESVPVMILANKQDLPEAVDAPMLIKLLGLHTYMTDRTFAIFDCSAIDGRGIKEAFVWLVNQLEMNV